MKSSRPNKGIQLLYFLFAFIIPIAVIKGIIPLAFYFLNLLGMVPILSNAATVFILPLGLYLILTEHWIPLYVILIVCYFLLRMIFHTPVRKTHVAFVLAASLVFSGVINFQDNLFPDSQFLFSVRMFLYDLNHIFW